MSKRDQLRKIFADADIRIISISKKEMFGEEILSINPHINDLFNCDFDLLCDAVEAEGFKIEVASNGHTLMVK